MASGVLCGGKPAKRMLDIPSGTLGIGPVRVTVDRCLEGGPGISVSGVPESLELRDRPDLPDLVVSDLVCEEHIDLGGLARWYWPTTTVIGQLFGAEGLF
jgi:hypothetical protein